MGCNSHNIDTTFCYQQESRFCCCCLKTENTLHYVRNIAFNSSLFNICIVNEVTMC